MDDVLAQLVVDKQGRVRVLLSLNKQQALRLAYVCGELLPTGTVGATTSRIYGALETVEYNGTNLVEAVALWPGGTTCKEISNPEIPDET